MLTRDGRDQVVAEYPSGMQIPTCVELIPLIYQMETIGQLLLAPRSRDETFTPVEHDLLQTIARQVAVAAYNVRLTEDLQRSRQDIVTAREEERRRLRRDLHDGLGPVLAAMSFRLDAVRNFVKQDPDQAQKLIDDLKSQVQSSLSEVRRIAYNLRPPALDELGLLGALRQHIESTQQT
jgi:signal transduction histidine kinase